MRPSSVSAPTHIQCDHPPPVIQWASWNISCVFSYGNNSIKAPQPWTQSLRERSPVQKARGTFPISSLQQSLHKTAKKNKFENAGCPVSLMHCLVLPCVWMCYVARQHVLGGMSWRWKMKFTVSIYISLHRAIGGVSSSPRWKLAETVSVSWREPGSLKEWA